jgi:putative membrane protein
MFLELIIALSLGILAGTITGLTPGIHINLVAMLVLINVAFFTTFVELPLLIIFIISMGTTHSFLDFIPSLVFGIPSSDTALSVLPAHRLVLDGKAYQALFLSSIGSLCGMFFAFLLLPLFYFSLEFIYDAIKVFIPYLLCFTLLSLVLLERKLKKIFWAVIIILLSGSLGLLILNTTLTDQALLLLFTGLFGISGILIALKDENSSFPQQEFTKNVKYNWNFFKAIGVGGICSSICSISPGIGNAQAATLASLFFKDIEAEDFILVTSAINTINFILSFLTFSLIARARNGSVYVISQLVEAFSIEEMIIYFGVIAFVAFLAFFLTLYLGKVLIKIVSKLNFTLINLVLLLFLISLIFYLESFFGLIVLIATSSLGILCILKEVRRVHLMAILLVPVILNLL